MTIDDIKNNLGNYAKDIRLNLSTVLGEEVLSEQQRYGTLLVSAYATKHVRLIKDIETVANEKFSEEEINGIKAAAKTYFSKTPNKLSIDESALLVGILKGTTVFSPIKNPERAIKRRNVVLEQMEKYGFISEAQLTENTSKELNLQFILNNR